jgi:uncharacterized protein YjhX (UPF0386 family)
MFISKPIELTLRRVLHLLRSGGKFPFNLLQEAKIMRLPEYRRSAMLASMVSLYDCRRLRIWSVIRVKNLLNDTSER